MKEDFRADSLRGMLTHIDLKVGYPFDVQSVHCFLGCFIDLGTALPKLDTVNIRVEITENDVRSTETIIISNCPKSQPTAEDQYDPTQSLVPYNTKLLKDIVAAVREWMRENALPFRLRFRVQLIVDYERNEPDEGLVRSCKSL